MLDDITAESQSFTAWLVGSLLGHGLVVMVLLAWPSSVPPLLSPLVTVRLLASLPVAPAPEAAAARAKPRPLQKKVVLPKQAPAAVPRPKRKAVARPAKVVRPRRADPQPALGLEDALDLLRLEQGEQRPEPDTVAVAPAAPASPQGVRVSPEMLAWQQAARRHVRSRWITPAEFLDRGLITVLTVELTEDGRVVGVPHLARPSGDPFWDDETIRAILRSSPLPAPPRAGETSFIFTPEDRR